MNRGERERTADQEKRQGRDRGDFVIPLFTVRNSCVCVCVYGLAVAVAAHPPLESPLKVRRDAKEGVERIPFSLFFSRDELCA